MNYQEENNYPKAFLATGIILAVMLALCYFIIFHNPPPEEDGTGGMVVNYGTTDAGMGDEHFSTREPSVAPKANQTPPDKITPVPPTEQKTQLETGAQKVVTQDNEDAPAVAAAKKPSKVISTETPRPVKQPKVVQAALYKGASNKGSGAGDGTTSTPGNQGSLNGSPLADNYGKGGTGNGVSGTQWSFVNMPDVKNTSRLPGIVTVDIMIDANGNIIDAHANPKKTRMGDLDLIDRCVDAVKKFHAYVT